ncbi:spore gernimation protein [Ammoniphilus oxalaticus]|uniref:Spore gernimation protein n=1 Tax=Ammoniphilus oxalaticus TaxID=66863 RepID=A0A419SKT7_9BACL|nr:Ger(x)C family spore germination protein [Ammoniphilus oxalaticus]RKD24623.1 spore gernimation protein [Ammoniphilus oxalaticus]
MKKRILVMLIFLTFLSGCWDANEPDRMFYINGIGVDFKDGKYEVYAQFIHFSNVAKSEQPLTQIAQAEVGHARGHTMDEAIFQLYHSADQRVYWGHFSYLVVSEEAMRKGKLSSVLDSFIRYKETRYQIWVYTTKDPVQDILVVNPILNKAITLSKLGDPENSYEQESFIEPINIRKLIIALDEPGHEAMIPLISVEENFRSIEKPIQQTALSGVGIVTPNSFKGFIESDKARGLQWMNNNTKRGQVTFKLDGENYLTMVIDKVGVNVEPIVSKGKVEFVIDVDLDATVSTIGENVTNARIKSEIEAKVEKEIKSTYKEALKQDIDIYRLSEQLYRKDVNTWKKHQKDGKLALSEESIRNLNINVKKLKSDRKSYQKTIEKL